MKPTSTPFAPVRAAACLLAVLMSGVAPIAHSQAKPEGVPLMKPALGASAPAGTVPAAPAAGTARTITWDALVPPGWDPYKDFRGLDLGTLVDGDPKATAMLKKMREAWDNAPVNQALVNQAVRIPGFVVPLEEGKDGVTEFLLVPYFGACVHSPPPPSNQIIHVLPKSPAKGLRSMDTVWITGKLTTVQTETYMGASSWRLEGSSVAPYLEPRR